MKRRFPPAVTFLFMAATTAGCAASGGPAAEGTYDVTVAAGEFERLATPVAFELPTGVAGRPYHLLAANGEQVPVQLDLAGRGHFVLDSLAANELAHFTLMPGDADGPEVELRHEGAAVVFDVDGRPVLRYNPEITELPRPDIDSIFARGGYIHPVYSPDGVVVTGDYPPDHLHHHGIWASWTRTVFEGQEVDFWNVADEKGDVLPVALDSAWRGNVFGGFTARHRYVSLMGESPKDALNERWTVRVFNVRGSGSPYWLFDLDVEQSTATSSPLVLPEYHYGGVAIRGRDDWYGESNAFFLTSEGNDRSNGNETRARWTHMGGMVDGRLEGVAVLSHPGNFRHPEPVRIHPNEPYFVWAPSQLGEWSITPESPHLVRYRYVVHDGAPDAAELDRIWNDFAHPPVVTVSVS